MSCYFVAQIDIHDPDEYDKYLAGYDEVFDKFKGKVVAVDDKVSRLEGEWPIGRTVIIRFPDMAEARRWYDSPEYQALAVHRRNASRANIALVEGRDGQTNDDTK
jgi:uncharacterized protein (DUF1330 family)